MARLYAASTPWYRALNRNQWNALIGSNLGWVFDGYETYAVILTVGVALRQLLDPALLPAFPSMPAPSSASRSWAGASAA